MPKTITLNNVKILDMHINPEAQNITVKWVLLESSGEIYGREKVETYWVTLPSNAQSSDVQLPANYITLVTDLYVAALAALKGKYA